MSIPVVIFHCGGNQSYFVSCVNVSSKKNTVYLIGDDVNKNSFKNNKNVHFFHINDLESEETKKFKKCFVNYSGNNHHYEMYCFLRVFYLKTLFEKTKDEWMFHTDSDCVLLEDANKLFTPPFQISYSIQNVANEYHMVGSIHNSLLNLDFCNKFIQLCFDIYDNHTKFQLINKKIQWHKTTGTPGGICDMTLYYLLYSEKIIENVVDLNIPMSVDGENTVFDHNLSDAYGYNGECTFEKQNGIKLLLRTANGYYFKTVNGDFMKLASIHFQGDAKRILEKFST